ncbi:hydrogenase small subunit [candidate division KSB1 bacterium]|nr:hydrogenase small subunit [candidate division KSB1 bacterium]
MSESLTVFEVMESRGVKRRDFLKFCGATAALLGLPAGGMNAIAQALETKPRLPVIWHEFQSCTCCSESFIRSGAPLASDVVLNTISLDYSEVLMAAAGEQAEKAREDSIKKNKGKYILCVEGAIPTKDDGIYCMIAGHKAKDILRESAKDAYAIIAWGNCASFGCIQAAKPNPTGATVVTEILKDMNKPIINVPGCPPVAEVMTALVTHILTFEKIPALDEYLRPKAFYSHRIHDKCYRRPFYDAGMFVEEWDDEGARNGWCLYKMGCKGPITYNACAVVKHNFGTSFPIQSGHGCFACSEPAFWDTPLYDHIPGLAGPGAGNADTIGVVATVAAAAGAVGHYAVSAAKKSSKKEKVEKKVQEKK